MDMTMTTLGVSASLHEPLYDRGAGSARIAAPPPDNARSFSTVGDVSSNPGFHHNILIRDMPTISTGDKDKIKDYYVMGVKIGNDKFHYTILKNSGCSTVANCILFCGPCCYGTQYWYGDDAARLIQAIATRFVPASEYTLDNLDEVRDLLGIDRTEVIART